MWANHNDVQNYDSQGREWSLWQIQVPAYMDTLQSTPTHNATMFYGLKQRRAILLQEVYGRRHSGLNAILRNDIKRNVSKVSAQRKPIGARLEGCRHYTFTRILVQVRQAPWDSDERHPEVITSAPVPLCILWSPRRKSNQISGNIITDLLGNLINANCA